MNKRGRPRKPPDIIQKEKEAEKAIVETKIQSLLDQAVELFGIPYDDREERPSEAPTLSYVAEQMNTSRMRVRKLLITAGFFSSQLSRQIADLYNSGKSIQEISALTGLKGTTVQSYLPFKKVIYKMDDPSYNATQCKLYLWRRKSCENLKRHLDDEDYLWDAILAFEKYHFRTAEGRRLCYTVEGDSICFDQMRISQEEIVEAYRGSRPCTGELYTVFLRLGVVDDIYDRQLARERLFPHRG